MTMKRWSQVEAIFHAAEPLNTSDRATFLDRQCGEDDALRAEVESLLSFSHGTEKFLEIPADTLALSVIGKTDQQQFIGKTLNSYKVTERLGEGGMGEVFLCEDTKLGRRVALKFLPVCLADDEVAIKRFQQEAKTTSLLNHPNIITVYEIGEAEGRVFIATEFVEGKTLRQLIDAGSLTTDEILRIISAVARALEAAHNAGIIHRDIKPENIMVRDDGLVKLLDFGLAKQPLLSTDPASPNSVPGVILGTVSYMSPEQIRGLAVDERTDIWSLGVVLFEMVTGEKLFRGETQADILASIIGNTSILTALRGNMAPSFSVILRRAVRSERDQRYQKVRELLDDLTDIGLDNQSSSLPVGRALENSSSSPLMNRFVELEDLATTQSLQSQSSWRLKLSVGGLVVALLTLSLGLAVHYKRLGPSQSLQVSAPSQANLIERLASSTHKHYALGRLDLYSTAFIDRATHSFTRVPAFLMNQPYIITANDDRCSEREPGFSLTFDVTQPATVYVAHDDRYKKKPVWLDSFERTENTITLFLVGQPEAYVFHLYKRDYPVGQVVLGSNIDETCGQEGSFAMYSVIVTPRISSAK